MTDYFVGLNAVLVTKARAVLAGMAAAGHPMRPCQGLRTAAYQHDVLYAQGRTIPGPGVSSTHPIGRTVTNCDGFKTPSPHQARRDGTGHAIDCCFEGLDPFGIKQPWALYGQLVEAQGLIWGGRFKNVDSDHMQLPD